MQMGQVSYGIPTSGAGRTIRQTRHLPGAPGPIEGFWGPQFFFFFTFIFPDKTLRTVSYLQY